MNRSFRLACLFMLFVGNPGNPGRDLKRLDDRIAAYHDRWTSRMRDWRMMWTVCMPETGFRLMAENLLLAGGGGCRYSSSPDVIYAL